MDYREEAGTQVPKSELVLRAEQKLSLFRTPLKAPCDDYDERTRRGLRVFPEAERVATWEGKYVGVTFRDGTWTLLAGGGAGESDDGWLNPAGVWLPLWRLYHLPHAEALIGLGILAAEEAHAVEEWLHTVSDRALAVYNASHLEGRINEAQILLRQNGWTVGKTG